MKRIIALFLTLIILLILTACENEGVNVEYYDSTDIPTFTSVTGIELSSKYYENGMTMYIYNCKLSDVEKYVSFMIDLGFQKHDQDKYNSIKLESDSAKNRVLVLPYYGFEEGELIIFPL